MIKIKKADIFLIYTKSFVLKYSLTPFFLKGTACKHFTKFYKVVIQKFSRDGDIVLIKYQIDTTNIACSTYIF